MATLGVLFRRRGRTPRMARPWRYRRHHPLVWTVAVSVGIFMLVMGEAYPDNWWFMSRRERRNRTGDWLFSWLLGVEV